MNSNELFPVYGVILGQTTFVEIESIADKVEIFEQEQSAYINNVCFIEINEEKCIRYAAICNSQQRHADIPKKWRNALELNWGMSCEECKSILENKGYHIESVVNNISGRNYYNCLITAISPDDSYILELRTPWGEKGLQSIQLSLNDCPRCKSKDNEIITVNKEKLFYNNFICNKCGHRWGLKD